MPEHSKENAPSLPLYYAGKTSADMEQMLRADYLRRSGWLESADRKVALRDGKPVPWFTYPAIAFLERIVGPDVALFEYGGGQSTVYWAERVRTVDAIDHDPAFVRHIQPQLGPTARLRLVAEGGDIDPGILPRTRGIPDLPDPPRDTRTFRSGQLNTAFRNYAAQVLAWPTDHFDVVVVDGMARVLSTWAAIEHFSRAGFIVFDNADRDEYRAAYDMLEAAGYRRIDFWGLGPINPYEWCTAVFHRSGRSRAQWFAPRTARRAETPAAETGAEAPAGLGIAVFGYNRPHHLQSVLESLRMQGRISDTHVWIDGTQGRGEYGTANAETLTIARRYKTREIRAINSHLGIEKLMLDALETMSGLYDRVLVLEDDCFVLEGGVAAFETALAETADDPRVYSVYGHHFGVEPHDQPDFPRFQGWGWAAHSDRIRALLPELWQLFAMSEADYLAHIRAEMTDTIRARLDRTPGRNVLDVLDKFFSWDSATAFLTARRGLVHRRTDMPAVVNTGIVPGIGHFRKDQPRLRKPPFGMITLGEAWDFWDRTTVPCRADKPSYGLDQLDLRILDALEDKVGPGTFVELGAHDGVTQSNSVLLEARGWRGLLIEACPAAYARCVRARPRMPVEHALCVATGQDNGFGSITDVGLMSLVDASTLSEDERAAWLARGEGFAGRPAQEIAVAKSTLGALIDKHGLGRIDLLLLDVEGAEIEVLSGLDFARQAPSWIVAEDPLRDDVGEFLAQQGYVRDAVLLERKFTRDCLYRYAGPGPSGDVS